MDEYLENYNQEEEDEQFQELDQRGNENPQQINENQEEIRHDNEQHNLENDKSQASAQNAGLVDNYMIENQKNMIENIGNNKDNKQNQFYNEMVRITSQNFRKMYQCSKEMKEEISEDINHIKEAIKMQMEYYFSDTNLIHDKYLRCIIEKSPNNCVDIKLFLKFKRIQQIIDPIIKGKIKISDSTYSHQNMHQKGQKINNQHQQQQISKKELIHFVRDSLIHSLILKVKKDSQKVKRFFPFNLEQAEISSKEKTLYVDYLPPKCTKSTLVAIFDNFHLTNINLPLQKDINLCKGYAFIEFSTSEEANQALNAKNSSIPKELILLAEKKIGQGSIRIITHKKWEEEKIAFKNLCSNNSSQSGSKIGEKRKSSHEFTEVDVNIVYDSLIKIVNIPPNILKAEIVLAVKHLGYQFYCDYLDNNETESKNALSQDNNMNQQHQNSNSQVIQLKDILQVGQAMIRFQNSKDKQQAVQKALQLNDFQLQLEIRGQKCDIINVIEGQEEIKYWNFVKQKKNEFRQFFYKKKLEKKQKINENNKN